MTVATLVLRNLGRRPTRTLLTAVGVAIGVGLIVALLSITTGVHRTAADLIHLGRSDFGLFQDGVSDFTRSLVPDALARKIAREPGVAETARVKLYVSDSLLVFGLAREEFPYERLVLVDGRRGGALLGDAAARRLHVGVGDTLHVRGRAFIVTGIFHSGDRFEDGGAVLPLETVERVAGHPGDATTIAVTVTLGQNPKHVARTLEEKYALAAITEPGQAVKVDTSSRLIVNTGWIISLLALIVGGIGVTNTMAMAVVERVREIGILRAVGWRASRIALLIVSEAIGIALIALGVGLGLGVLAADLFSRRSDASELVRPDFTAGVFAWGLAFALGVAVIGAAYPTWRAVRLTPIEALRRE